MFLIVARAIFAAILPLSADEAYYWLWSKHLAAGYFDHPPMIAWLIRAGTMLFGDTAFGVRFSGVVLSVPATWFVWKTAALVFSSPVYGGGGPRSGGGGQNRAALAALFFNLTLMTSIELLAATPDMPSVVTSAAFIYFLARAQQDNRGINWLGVGIAAGLGLLSKYATLFLGLGTLIWLLADPRARKCLLSPWPWFGAAFALAIFLPNLLWQSQHGWETFAFQFGRMGGKAWTARYVLEFIGAQVGLATPLIFVLMVCGLWRATRARDDRFFLAVLVWAGFAYFLQHALRDRVQGNWPCFLYPALAILAAAAVSTQGKWRWVSRAAAPLAAVMLLAVYAQAAFQLVPLKKDPLARVLGRDFAPVRRFAGEIARRGAVSAILTSDYETTAWLRFYEPGAKVVQVTDPWRYPLAPSPDARLLNGRLLYLVALRRDQHQQLAQDFGTIGFPTQAQTPSENYMLYPVAHPRHAAIGKMP